MPIPHAHPQVLKLQEVSAHLLAALEAQRQAKAAYDHARDHYDDRRQRIILDGLPSLKGRERCPAEEREAHLACALVAELAALRTARDTLRNAETHLEAARIVERAEREALRSIQREVGRHAEDHPQAI